MSAADGVEILRGILNSVSERLKADLPEAHVTGSNGEARVVPPKRRGRLPGVECADVVIDYVDEEKREFGQFRMAIRLPSLDGSYRRVDAVGVEGLLGFLRTALEAFVARYAGRNLEVTGIRLDGMLYLVTPRPTPRVQEAEARKATKKKATKKRTRRTKIVPESPSPDDQNEASEPVF